MKVNCIQCSVGINFTQGDLKYYIKKNRGFYLSFLIFFVLGVVIAVFICVSTSSYLSLLSSSDKVLFDYVNGSVSYSKEATKLIFKLLMVDLLVFVLNLNFYSGLISYAIISYQSCLMFLSIVAQISAYGFTGFLIVLFLQLPVNLVMFALNIAFAVTCLERSYNATLSKNFALGFQDKSFWLTIFLISIVGVIFSLLIVFVFIVILRMRIFIIF